MVPAVTGLGSGIVSSFKASWYIECDISTKENKNYTLIWCKVGRHAWQKIHFLLKHGVLWWERQNLMRQEHECSRRYWTTVLLGWVRVLFCILVWRTSIWFERERNKRKYLDKNAPWRRTSKWEKLHVHRPLCEKRIYIFVVY